MTIIPSTRQPVKGSTKVAHSILKDRSLTDEARGLLIYLMSKPEGWIFTVGRIARHKHLSEAKVRRALRLIEGAGYLQRMPVRKNGRNAGFRVAVKRQAGRFALIPNRYVSALSIQALGLLGVLAAAPPGWVWTARGLLRATGVGAYTLQRLLGELVTAGAVEKERVRHTNGQYGGMILTVVGVPKPALVLPKAEKPKPEKRKAEKRVHAPPGTLETAALSKKETSSKKKEEKEDATLSIGDGGAEAKASHPQPAAGGVTPSPQKTRTKKPKKKEPSPAFRAAQSLKMPEKHRRRWMGLARNLTSRGAANGIAAKWPDLIPALMHFSFAARLTAHTTAIWTQDVYRAAKEHGPKRVAAALERASRSRDPLTTFKRALAEEPFDPMAVQPPINPDLWRVLVLHLERMNGSLGRPQVELLLGKLVRWIKKHGHKATEEAVSRAVERGWRNVYEPKPGGMAWNHKPASNGNVPRLASEHEVFGHRDPWRYPWPKRLLDVVGPPPDPDNIEACREWFWEVGEKALYAEHFDIPQGEAAKVCEDWGFKL